MGNVLHMLYKVTIYWTSTSVAIYTKQYICPDGLTRLLYCDDSSAENFVNRFQYKTNGAYDFRPEKRAWNLAA